MAGKGIVSTNCSTPEPFPPGCHVLDSVPIFACSAQSDVDPDSIYSFSKQAGRLLHLLKDAIHVQDSGNITAHSSPYLH